jgi:multicomponent K+:H+ antiporter subunit A
MLAMLSRPLLPLGLTVAAFLFLRGHNMPGGGFVAGLIAAVAFMLQYLASGQAFAQERARIDFARLTSAGLAIAIGTGIASWSVGFPFLTSTFVYIKWPIIEQFEIASAMAFDLGVFLTVLGSVLLILTTLGALSQRELAHSRSAASVQRSA